MNTILEWALVALFVVGALCALALVAIWLWARGDAAQGAVEPRDYAEAERGSWMSFKARMAQEERDNKLGRLLGASRVLK